MTLYSRCFLTVTASILQSKYSLRGKKGDNHAVIWPRKFPFPRVWSPQWKRVAVFPCISEQAWTWEFHSLSWSLWNNYKGMAGGTINKCSLSSWASKVNKANVEFSDYWQRLASSVEKPHSYHSNTTSQWYRPTSEMKSSLTFMKLCNWETDFKNHWPYPGQFEHQNN